MEKKRWFISLLLSLLLMTSCGHPDIWQKDWHINNIELADKYFPRYFEAIEEILQKKDFQYEKLYYKQFNETFECKNYIATYNLSEKIYFKTELTYDYSFKNKYAYMSKIDFTFNYESATEEEIFNISHSYLDVMVDVTCFCSYSFFGKEESFDMLYDELKEKYYNHGYSLDNPPTYNIVVKELTWEETPPLKQFLLDYKNGRYDLIIRIRDYLTDVNIWSE